MTRKSSHSIRYRIIRHLREWHRKLGIIAAFFLIFLSVSGIALNHTESLALAKFPIKSTTLLDHYGITAPKDIRFYDNGNISITNDYVWFDGKLLMESDEKVIGGFMLNDMVVLVMPNQISLFTQNAEQIDVLDSLSGLPADIMATYVSNNAVTVKTPTGFYQSDRDLMDWQSIQFIREPIWLEANQVEQSAIEDVSLAYRAQFLTFERIILDAHSGRLFGTVGVLFMDLVALLLILLSLSGVYMWIRHSRSKR